MPLPPLPNMQLGPLPPLSYPTPDPTLAALTSAGTGFMQGQMEKPFQAAKLAQQQQQVQLGQEQIEESKFKRAAQRWGFLSKLLTASPAFAQNPQVIQSLTEDAKALGIPAPITNGQIDLNALREHQDFSTWIADPKNLDTWLSLNPDERKSLAAGAGFANVPDALINTKTRKALGQQALSAAMSLIRDLGDPNKSPEAQLAKYNAARRILAEANIDLPGIDQMVTTSVSPYIQAKIDEMKSKGQVDKAKIAQLEESVKKMRTEEEAIKALEALRDVQATYIAGAKTAETEARTKLLRTQNQRTLAAIDLDKQKVQIAEEKNAIAKASKARGVSAGTAQLAGKILGHIEALNKDREAKEKRRTQIEELVAGQKMRMTPELTKELETLASDLEDITGTQDMLWKQYTDLKEKVLAGAAPAAQTPAAGTPPPIDPTQFKGQRVRNKKDGSVWESDGKTWQQVQP